MAPPPSHNLAPSYESSNNKQFYKMVTQRDLGKRLPAIGIVQPRDVGKYLHLVDLNTVECESQEQFERRLEVEST